jgi:chromosome segregation ATPase
MRESGHLIESNRLGDAASVQDSIIEGLDELLDALANRRELELQRRLDKLEDAARDLADLRGKQAEVTGQIEDPEKDPESTGDRQQTLADEARRLSRRLERLLAEEAAEATSEASSAMQTSADEVRSGDRASAREDAGQAEEQLQRAEEQLRSEKRQAEQDLLFEQMAQLQQEIAGLIGRQQAVWDTTREMEGLRAEQGQWSRGQRSTVAGLARQQRSLATDTGRAIEQTQGAAVFRKALQGVVAEMDRAARGLDNARTDAATQLAQQGALNRLKQLHQSLQRDTSSGEEAGPGPGQGPPPQMPPGNPVQRLAELKLLKSMQEEINRRTAELEQMRPVEGPLPDEMERTLGELAQEQRELAELVFGWSRRAAGGDPEGRPAAAGPAEEEEPADLDQKLEEELLKGLENLP